MDEWVAYSILALNVLGRRTGGIPDINIEVYRKMNTFTTIQRRERVKCTREQLICAFVMNNSRYGPWLRGLCGRNHQSRKQE